MSEAVTYAKAGVTPEDWMCLEVVDVARGAFVSDVVEVDVVGGYVIVLDRDERGRIRAPFGQIAHRRIEGRFAIHRLPARVS